MAEVGRMLGLTRARVAQLLELTLLPVEVQEQVLFAEAVEGREPVTESELRRARKDTDNGLPLRDR